MDTNEQLLNRLTASIDECGNTLANPKSNRIELLAANDKVLGIVSTCNLSLKTFNDSERVRFEGLYEKATQICGRTRRFAALLK